MLVKQPDGEKWGSSFKAYLYRRIFGIFSHVFLRLSVSKLTVFVFSIPKHEGSTVKTIKVKKEKKLNIMIAKWHWLEN